MSHLIQAIQVPEKTPGATRSAFGVAIPTDRDFAFFGPAFDRLESDDGLVSVACQPRGHAGLSFVSPRVHRWIWSRLTRHAIGTPSFDEEGRARRESLLRKFMASLPEELRAEHAPFAVGAVAHYGVGALGMAVADVAAVLREKVDATSVDSWVLAALEGGAFYEFDSVGREHDEAAARAKVEAAKCVEAVRVDEARLKAPNTKTLAELDMIAVEAVKGQPLPGYLRPRLSTERCLYALLPRALVMHAEIPSGFISRGVTVLDETFVLPVTVGELEAAEKSANDSAYSVYFASGEREFTEVLGFAEWLMREHRPETGLDARSSTASAEWDESTAEGRYRSEAFDHDLKDEWLPGYAGGSGYDGGPHAGFRIAMAFAAGARGRSLAEDVVASILHRRISAKWTRSHTMNGTCPPLPRWCESEEALLDKGRELLTTYGPLFLADELYEPPKAGALERVKDVLRIGDAWATPIKSFVEGKELVTSSELDDRLRAVGAVTGSLGPQQYQRVHRIMTRLDWYKTERVVDGRRVKVWVKAQSAEVAT